ncbi:MAG: AIR synthase related protein [Patescibacteria group bacterium]|nr:phosphoribosylformylglycinamidine cyclo-ligase [Patescibacteria group bacterium]
MNKSSNLTYKKTGVDYSKIDPLKIMAQKAALKTSRNLVKLGLKEITSSRGESAYIMDMGSFYLASITECLGTKVLVADAMRQLTGKSYYDAIAQDTIAMAVNDIITVGARPISIHAYWAAGSSKWFEDEKRIQALVAGWRKSCDLCGAVWGGGETPALSGVVNPNTIDLAASCVGIIKPKSRLILNKKLQAGDVMIALASSGIHANGLTLARKIADRLDKGYLTKMTHQQTYGQALLKPTPLYSNLIQSLLASGIKIKYISNITGHGWRKIMRHPLALTYRINRLPPVPKVLRFMVEKGPLSLKEAYGSLNMGAGIVIFVPAKQVAKTLSVAQHLKIKAYEIGGVEKGPKQVIIEPLDLIFEANSIKLRG